MSINKQTKRHTISIYTIGANEKTAEEFFGLIMDAGVHRVIDIRLRNNSQVLGFTKMTHLPFFLREVAGIGYEHMPNLAPTKDILNAWRDKKITWKQYVARFTPLLRERKIENLFEPGDLDYACLLCSESQPDECHRRLVVEDFRDRWADSVKVNIVHL